MNINLKVSLIFIWVVYMSEFMFELYPVKKNKENFIVIIFDLSK